MSLVVVKETMASKGLIKRVRQLQQKKYRSQTNQFVVEGSRAITEVIKNKDAFDCVHLLTTKEQAEVVVHRGVLDHVVDVGPRYQSVTPSEMSKMTGLSTACDSLAVLPFVGEGDTLDVFSLEGGKVNLKAELDRKLVEWVANSEEAKGAIPEEAMEASTLQHR